VEVSHSKEAQKKSDLGLGDKIIMKKCSQYSSWTRGQLLSGVAAIMFLIPAGAIAQTTADDRETQVRSDRDVIIVTAQKREERILDVPLAITAITGIEIERRNSSSLMDLQYTVPGLSLTQNGPGQQRLQLRGITTSNGLPTVGQYLDEMPLSIDDNTQALDLRLLDIERVEVLRGPQGTLYGEGSMGGTIRYITTDPVLTRFESDAEAQVGMIADGGVAWRVNGVVNVPVIEDRVGVRLLAGYEDTGGWIDSAVTGEKDINKARILTLRGKILAQVTDNLEASILFLHQEQEQDYQNYGINRQSTALVQEINNPNYDLLNAVVRLDLGWAELMNSFGYQSAQNATRTDLSGVYVPLLPLLGFPAGFITSVGLNSTSDIEVLTDEIRLSSSPGGAFEWTVGLYGRTLDRTGVSLTVTAPGVAPFDLISATSTAESDAWAAFGELTWHTTESLTVTGGLRYFEEKRTLAAVSANFGVPASNTNEGSFDSLNPRLNISYDISLNGLVYASAAKGFRSGGFNAAAAGGPLSYDPEKLWTYEAGAKHQFFDRRLTVEGAVYYTDWDDVQSSFFNPGAALGYITNGGTVQGWGIDASLSARPTDGLTLSATYGWNNMEYKTASAEHAVGDPVDYAVRESWSGSIDYRRPVTDNVLGFARLDYQHAGPSFIINRGAGVNTRIDSRDLLNAAVGIDLGALEVSLFVTNLTDDDTPIVPGPIGLIQQDVEQTPRVIGVNTKLHF